MTRELIRLDLSQNSGNGSRSRRLMLEVPRVCPFQLLLNDALDPKLRLRYDSDYRRRRFSNCRQTFARKSRLDIWKVTPLADCLLHHRSISLTLSLSCSALDIFGGSQVKFDDLVEYNEKVLADRT